MCTDGLGGVCNVVSTESMGVRGRTFPYIPTKGTGMHGFMYMENSMVKMVVRGRTNAYDEYGRYETIRDIGMGIVKKVRKGISYDDAI